MKRRFAAFLASVLCAVFVLTGCAADVEYQMTINKNNSVMLEATLTLDDDSYDAFGSLYMQSFISTLRRDGYTVTESEDNGSHEIVASITVDDLQKMTESAYADVLPVSGFAYGAKKSLFYNKYALDMTLDMTDFFDELDLRSSVEQAIQDEEDAKADQTDGDATSDDAASDPTDSTGDLSDSPDTDTAGEEPTEEERLLEMLDGISAKDVTMKMTVTMPAKITKDNSTEAKASSRSAVWVLSTSGSNTIHAEMVSANAFSIFLFVLLLLLALAFAGMMFLQFKKYQVRKCPACKMTNRYTRLRCRSCGKSFSKKYRQVVESKRRAGLLGLLAAILLLLILIIGSALGKAGTVKTEPIPNNTSLAQLINGVDLYDPLAQTLAENEKEHSTSSETESSGEGSLPQETGSGDEGSASGNTGTDNSGNTGTDTSTGSDNGSTGTGGDTGNDGDGSTGGPQMPSGSATISKDQAASIAQNRLADMGSAVPSDYDVSDTNGSSYTVTFYDDDGNWFASIEISSTTGEVLNQY